MDVLFLFFFKDTATTDIYTLSLHDALPILSAVAWPYANGPRHIGHVAGFGVPSDIFSRYMRMAGHDVLMVDRKSTRLNSSHGYISYAVFCLKKKKRNKPNPLTYCKLDSPPA